MVEYRSEKQRSEVHIFKDGKCLCPFEGEALFIRNPSKSATMCKECLKKFREQMARKARFTLKK